MILLEGVTKIYPVSKEMRVTAMHDVTLEVARGEFVVVTGRSGSGKTTLLNLVAGLTRPTSGRVLVDGRDVWKMSDRQRSRLRNRTFGFVFQFPSLLPSLTVLQNVVMPEAFSPNGSGSSTRDRAKELLESVGLAEKVAAYPRQLSAGQQQRVVIARALINEPEVLLADEPTSDLDEQTECEIMDLFAQIHARTGVTVILVTHTTQLVRYGTRAVRMVAGRLATADDASPAAA